MDPEATLQEAKRLVNTRRYMDALDCINSYQRWRSSEGFEPEDGDLRAKTIQRVCRAAINGK